MKANRAHNVKRLRTMHISSLPIWDMGQGKGRLSTYLPLRTLCDRGHEVWYLTTNKDQKSGKVDGINIKRLKTILSYSKRRYCGTFLIHLNSLFGIFQSLIIGLRYKPDVIYAHDFHSAITTFIVSRVVNSKYILKQYGTTYFVLGRSDYIFRMIYRILLYLPHKLSADIHIVTNDGTLGDMAAKSYDIPPDKLCFWVNGIGKDWVNGPVNDKLRQKLAPGNEKIVLSLSRLVRPKQVGFLVKAIPRVVETYKSVTFVIVGDGSKREYLEQLVRELGISDFVRFEGAVLHEKALEYMKVCDVFVSMNGASSICNPVLETMVCGKPVIALNTGATGELIKHNYNGLLVNVDEIDRLPDTILSLLTNEDHAKKLGENAQRFMLENWPTWEERTGWEAELIESLCSNDPERIAVVKKEADAVLNLGIRLSKRNRPSDRMATKVSGHKAQSSGNND